MKNKTIALLLAVLTTASALASTVSAGDIFVSERGDKKPSAQDAAIADTEDEKDEQPAKSSGGVFVWAKDGTTAPYKDAYSKKNTTTVKVSDKDTLRPVFKGQNEFGQPVYKEPILNDDRIVLDDYYWQICGGMYFPRLEGEKELKKYFEKNSYDLYFKEGDERTFCEGAYFYSTDPDVVYYDYRTGRLVADNTGSADVYVCTAGGVPFFRLDVSVTKNVGSRKPSLEVVPEDWHLSIGETTKFKVYASDGKEYDDIKLEIWQGSDYADLGGQSGKLTARANGAVVVHAYSASNRNIYGDALVYIGRYDNAVTDGYWVTCEGGIVVERWECDLYFPWRDCVKGWIKTSDGILVPVIRVEDGIVVEKDGTRRETTVVTGGLKDVRDVICGRIG